MKSQSSALSAALQGNVETSRSARVLTPGLLAGFAVIILVLIATLVIGLANLRNVAETSAVVAHTHAVKAGLERLLATIMVDRRGTIHLVNTLTEQLLGYTRAELMGQSVERLVPTRFGEAHAGFREAFFADSQSRPMGEGRDLYALRKDGTEMPVAIGLSPVETADGVFVLAAVTDITERKRTAALLQQAFDAERVAKREAEQRPSVFKPSFASRPHRQNESLCRLMSTSR